MSFLADIITKNGPELHALFTGGLPSFITAREPRPLEQAIPVFCYHLVDHEEFTSDLQFLGFFCVIRKKRLKTKHLDSRQTLDFQA